MNVPASEDRADAVEGGEGAAVVGAEALAARPGAGAQLPAGAGRPLAREGEPGALRARARPRARRRGRARAAAGGGSVPNTSGTSSAWQAPSRRRTSGGDHEKR